MPLLTQENVNIEPLRKALDIIVQTIDPEKIILFGSHATGNNGENSDYDLCIIKETKENKNHLAQQLYLDLYGCGEAIDLIIETPESYEKNKDDKYMIYYQIEKNGIVVYERD